MPKCPNCGRETQRTADWACQWCGHPLLSGAFKKIPQTYRELQEERSLMPRVVPEYEPEPVLVAEAEAAPAPPPAPVAEPEPQPEPEPEVSPPPEPVVEAKAGTEIEKEPAPPPEPEVETVADSEPVTTPEPATIEEPEPKAKAKAEPVPEPVTMEEPEAEPLTEVEPEIAARPAPQPAAVPSLEPDPATGTISVTAEELNAAFNADKVGTNTRLTNKLLKVTGPVDKIFAKDHLDIFYILLGGNAGRPVKWQVRCTFSSEHGMYLSRLTEGQSAMVQGTYAGHERNIILKDCILLQ
jgi:hypothetical protein